MDNEIEEVSMDDESEQFDTADEDISNQLMEQLNIDDAGEGSNRSDTHVQSETGDRSATQHEFRN